MNKLSEDSLEYTQHSLQDIIRKTDKTFSKLKNFLENEINPKRSGDSSTISSRDSSNELPTNKNSNDDNIQSDNIKSQKNSNVNISSRVINKINDKKITNLIEKTLPIIKDIRLFLEKGTPQADGEEDYHRRLKRVQEFSSRFSRNYLYPLVLQIEDLEKCPQNSQKIVVVHQIIYQGLVSYCNYLPSSTGNCSTEKIKPFLVQIGILCKLSVGINPDNDEFIKALECHVTNLIEAINSFLIDKKQPKTTRKLKTLPPPKKVVKKTNNTRFAMYTTSASFHKNPNWKKTVENINKKKYNVKSRYKTSLFKHRPPVDKSELPSNRSSAKMKGSFVINKINKESSVLQNTPITSPLNETKLETLMGLDTIENSIEIKCEYDDDDIYIHEDNNNDNDSGDLQMVQYINKKHTIDKTIFGLNTETINNENKQINKIMSSQKLRKELIIHESGEKNARLICIKDDNSLNEQKYDCHGNEEYIMEKQLTYEENIYPIKNLVKPRQIKISRLPKMKLRPLELLSKERAIKIIQYKLEYHKFTNGNFLYRKSSTIQPWHLVDKITDNILIEILISIVGEIEIEPIVNTVYESEFQY